MSKREERLDEKNNVHLSTLNTIMEIQCIAELPMFKGVLPDTIPLIIYVGHGHFRASGNDGVSLILCQESRHRISTALSLGGLHKKVQKKGVLNFFIKVKSSVDLTIHFLKFIGCMIVKSGMNSL